MKGLSIMTTKQGKIFVRLLKQQRTNKLTVMKESPMILSSVVKISVI